MDGMGSFSFTSLFTSLHITFYNPFRLPVIHHQEWVQKQHGHQHGSHDAKEELEHVIPPEHRETKKEKCVNRELNPDLYLGRVES